MTAKEKQVTNWRQQVFFFFFFFFTWTPENKKNEKKTAKNMKKKKKKKNKNEQVKIVSKSPKQGNIPKPRYCRGEYWPKVVTDSPFLFVVGIKNINYVQCSLLASGYDLENEVHYMRRLVSGHGLKNEVLCQINRLKERGTLSNKQGKE